MPFDGSADAWGPEPQEWPQRLPGAARRAGRIAGALLVIWVFSVCLVLGALFP